MKSLLTYIVLLSVCHCAFSIVSTTRYATNTCTGAKTSVTLYGTACVPDAVAESHNYNCVAGVPMINTFTNQSDCTGPVTATPLNTTCNLFSPLYAQVSSCLTAPPDNTVGVYSFAVNDATCKNFTTAIIYTFGVCYSNAIMYSCVNGVVKTSDCTGANAAVIYNSCGQVSTGYTQYISTTCTVSAPPTKSAGFTLSASIPLLAALLAFLAL